MMERPEPIGTGESTLEVNQVQMARREAEFSGVFLESDDLIDTRQLIRFSSKMTKHESLDSLSKSDILNLVRKQESALENAEAAVGHLERRLRILENKNFRSESMKNTLLAGVPDDFRNLGQNPPEKDFIGHYSCIYVSPIYDEKKGSIMYRTQIVEDSHGMRNRSFNDRMRDDVEMKRLKTELQMRDLEIRKLKTELQRRRLQNLEEERNTIADKFIDKINTIRTPTISRPKSYSETQHSKADQSGRTNYCDIENLGESINKREESQGFMGSHCGNPKINFSPNGFMKIMKDKLVVGKRENGEGLPAVPELDRSTLAPDWSRSSNEVQKTVRSFLATMQTSVENLCNSFKICESRDSDSSKINSGATEDELFILKKTLCKLAEVCEESGYQSFCEDGKESPDVQNVGDIQSTIDGIVQQLAQSEFKVIALEASCLEKDRKVEDLENRIHRIIKECETIMVEKYELTTTVQEMHREAEEQRHRIEELLSINEELLSFSQTKEEQLGNLQEEKDHLVQQLAQIEDNFTSLESSIQEKDEEIEELNRRLKAGQIGTDTVIIEKIELMAKMQVINKEADDQKRRIEEFVVINEELLEFAQTKEDQLALLNEEVKRLRRQPEEKSEDNERLAECLKEENARVKDLEERKS